MTGGSLPASIWRTFMSRALEGVPATPFPGKDGAASQPARRSESVTVTICDASGMLATPNCPHTHQQTYSRQDAPSSYCTIHNAQNGRKVPSVVGMSSGAARTAVQSAGYNASVVNQASNEPPDTVVGQAPAAGTVLAAGGSVTIYVSTGPAQHTVPGVVGLTEAAARTKIAVAGFAASATYVPGSPPGVVVSQSPSAGSKMAPGSTVSISVATGGTGAGIAALYPWLASTGASRGR
jgi:serine/threonine-protein kinase